MNVENVVVGGEDVVLAVNGEGHVWVGVELAAVWLRWESLDQWVNELLWSNEEGGSGVNDGLVLGGIDLGAALGDAVEFEGPVFLLDDCVLLDGGVVLGVHTWDDHVALGGGVVEVEGEALVGQAAGFHEGGKTIDGDASVGKTEDTRHLGGKEGNTGDGGDLTEAHRGSDAVTNGGNVLGDGTLDAS